ncbi:hypothetical protein [Aeromonas caviae]|uniref:hypothetical protein n=1 Tax=Aeromonas caviae TaxID=648 RepID=UPI0029D661EF|nr:hypothetical protein [Aeromonas caviae]MDX7711782.1 hypothetical protein [Aeromonas caviae]
MLVGSDKVDVVPLVIFQKLVVKDDGRRHATEAGRLVFRETDVIVMKIVSLSVVDVFLGDDCPARDDPGRLIPTLETAEPIGSDLLDEVSDGTSEGFAALFQLFSQVWANGNVGYRPFGIGVYRRDDLSK